MMATVRELQLRTPALTGDWLNVTAWKALNETEDGSGSWAENVPALWAHSGDAGVSAHADDVRRLVEGLAATTPAESRRYVRMAPPYGDPTTVTLTAVDLPEATPKKAVRREQAADGTWVLRFPGATKEIHATVAGAAAPAGSLDALFGKLSIEIVKTGGVVRGIADFIDFWSLGGRV